MTPEEKVRDLEIHGIYDKLGELLQGLSIFEATYIIGMLVADQSSSKQEASDICELIEEAAHFGVEEDQADLTEVANELPV